MASREEEKRKRREERMAAEKAAQSSANRQRQLQFLLGAVLVIAIIVGVVVAASGGGSKNNPAPAKSSAAASKASAIPPASNPDLTSAAKAAGCVLLNPPEQGRSHVNTAVHYKSNPPTSGNHNPVPALDGIYSPGQEPTPEHFVHTLEHGRIEVQYRPGTPKAFESKLETLVSEPLNGKAAYKVLLFENNTHMPYAVAATAWGHLIGCKTVKQPQIFDALRDFRVKYVDQGPEKGIPPTN
jgi:hypothetical protein